MVPQTTKEICPLNIGERDSVGFRRNTAPNLLHEKNSLIQGQAINPKGNKRGRHKDTPIFHDS
jgi:hypothetical protein